MQDLAALAGAVLDGKYRLEGVLGQGGMGGVFKATHLGTDRTVAVKLISPGLMEQDEFVERFQREARATGRLRHGNIVDLTDFGFAELDGRRHAYLVMEFLVGCPLADVLAEQKGLPVSWVADILSQACAGLQHAHDRGIVHRDLKPDNLWLEPNGRGSFTVKILDFGLAKIYDPRTRTEGGLGLPAEPSQSLVQTRALEPDATRRVASGTAPLTELGTVLGTPAYMSPEQCRGVALDHRSDLYSMGVIAYQMLADRPPFQGNSLDLINSHIQSSVPPLGMVRPDLHPGITQLVMDALSKDPNERPASAEVFAGALEACAETELGLWRRALEFCLGRPKEIFAASMNAQAPALAVVLLFALWAAFGSRYHSDKAVVGIGAAFAVIWFGLVMRGQMSVVARVTVQALNWLVEPLGPPGAGPNAELEAWARQRRRVLLRTGIPMALLVAGWVLFVSNVENPDGSNLPTPLGWTGIGLMLAGMLGMWRFGRAAGSVLGGEYFLPCVVLFENLSHEQARQRSLALSGDPRTKLKRKGLTLLQALVFLLAWNLFLLPVWMAAMVLGEGRAGALAAAGIFMILVSAFAVCFTPLHSAHHAFEYFAFRRLCRESMRADFEAFHIQRLGGTQWSRRVEESIRTQPR